MIKYTLNWEMIGSENRSFRSFRSDYTLSAPKLPLVTLYRMPHYVNLGYRYTCKIKWWGPLIYRYGLTNLIYEQ